MATFLPTIASSTATVGVSLPESVAPGAWLQAHIHVSVPATSPRADGSQLPLVLPDSIEVLVGVTGRCVLDRKRYAPDRVAIVQQHYGSRVSPLAAQVASFASAASPGSAAFEDSSDSRQVLPIPSIGPEIAQSQLSASKHHPDVAGASSSATAAASSSSPFSPASTSSNAARSKAALSSTSSSSSSSSQHSATTAFEVFSSEPLRLRLWTRTPLSQTSATSVHASNPEPTSTAHTTPGTAPTSSSSPSSSSTSLPLCTPVSVALLVPADTPPSHHGSFAKAHYWLWVRPVVDGALLAETRFTFVIAGSPAQPLSPPPGFIHPYAFAHLEEPSRPNAPALAACAFHLSVGVPRLLVHWHVSPSSFFPSNSAPSSSSSHTHSSSFSLSSSSSSSSSVLASASSRAPDLYDISTPWPGLSPDPLVASVAIEQTPVGNTLRVTGCFDFAAAQVPCFRMSVTLESDEIVPATARPSHAVSLPATAFSGYSKRIVHATLHRFTLDAVAVPFDFTLPKPTPAAVRCPHPFAWPLLSVGYVLRFSCLIEAPGPATVVRVPRPPSTAPEPMPSVAALLAAAVATASGRRVRNIATSAPPPPSSSASSSSGSSSTPSAWLARLWSGSGGGGGHSFSSHSSTLGDDASASGSGGGDTGSSAHKGEISVVAPPTPRAICVAELTASTSSVCAAAAEAEAEQQASLGGGAGLMFRGMNNPNSSGNNAMLAHTPRHPYHHHHHGAMHPHAPLTSSGRPNAGDYVDASPSSLSSSLSASSSPQPTHAASATTAAVKNCLRDWRSPKHNALVWEVPVLVPGRMHSVSSSSSSSTSSSSSLTELQEPPAMQYFDISLAFQ